MVGIHDVAREVGVSASTVSRALRGVGTVSPATRTAIQDVASRLGYVASSSASGLATGRHMTVAVVVPMLSRWFYAEVLEGIDEVLRASGYDMLLINMGGRHGERQRVFHQELLRKRVDAVIALSYALTKPEHAQLRSLDLPVISIAGRTPGVRSVGIDDAAASRLVMHHLLDLGHSRIAHVGGEDVAGFNPSVPSLRSGVWRTMLEERGLPVPARWYAVGGFVVLTSAEAVRGMLGSPDDRPTAVFAASDEMAFGVLLAAHQLGLRVPEDLSVVGIDDHTDSVAFDLTTVRQDPAEQGRVAAQRIVDQLTGTRAAGRSVVSPTVLVVRGSTGPPPGEPS